MTISDPSTAAQALFQQAISALRKSRFQEAELCLRQILSLFPASPSAWNNLCIALKEDGEFSEAFRCGHRAVTVRPDYPEALCSLGSILRGSSGWEDALGCFRRAVILCPDFANGWSNLGQVAKENNHDRDRALALFSRCLRCDPESVANWINLSVTQAQQGQTQDAESTVRIALAIDPASSEALRNRAVILHDRDLMATAITQMDRAIVLAPEDPLAHFNLSLIFLSLGDYDKGWREHEWRLKMPAIIPRLELAEPRWQGDVTDLPVLIHAEYGIGDTIMFARFIKTAKERCAKLIFAAPRPLVALLEQSFRDIRILALDDRWPPFAFHCPLLSLPLIFGIALDDLLSPVPYLTADGKLAAKYRSDFPNAKLQIGLSWSGNPSYAKDNQRSIPLALFEPLFRIEGVVWHVLQTDRRDGDEAIIERTPNLVVYGGLSTTLESTAALISCLDLVISVDTSMAHLTGALGVPVWTLLADAPDWRWMRVRKDSPWYPSMILYRQSKTGSWPELLQQVAGALKAELSGNIGQKKGWIG